MNKIKLTPDIQMILGRLNNHGIGLIVGGYVRDSLLGLNPTDCDFSTNIPYDDLLGIFKDYNPKEVGKHFGVIIITVNGIKYEIAKFRSESNYSDNRRPDNVKFTESFYVDSARRDLTINSLGYDGFKVIDYHGGLNDIYFDGMNRRVKIRFIGNANERIMEDPVRMLRAVRINTKLNGTSRLHFSPIMESVGLINLVAKERIRDELNKILLLNNPEHGIGELHLTGLLKGIIPELHRCFGYDQNNPHHDKCIGEHTLSVLKATHPELETRLAALFHDIGKIKCETVDEDRISHFYGHHKISADMAVEIMQRLNYENEIIENVRRLIYSHMNIPETPRAYKRLIERVGVHNLDKLWNLQIADRISHVGGSMNDVLMSRRRCKDILHRKEPTNVRHLAINGKDLISLGYKQGTRIGEVLKDLLEACLIDPSINEREILLGTAKKMLWE